MEYACRILKYANPVPESGVGEKRRKSPERDSLDRNSGEADVRGGDAVRREEGLSD